METKLPEKKSRFLSNVARAVKQMPSTSTVESTTIDNLILRDLVQLENNASAGSMPLFVGFDQNVKQSSGESFCVSENPMTFACNLN